MAQGVKARAAKPGNPWDPDCGRKELIIASYLWISMYAFLPNPCRNQTKPNQYLPYKIVHEDFGLGNLSVAFNVVTCPWSWKGQVTSYCSGVLMNRAVWHLPLME